MLALIAARRIVVYGSKPASMRSLNHGRNGSTSETEDPFEPSKRWNNFVFRSYGTSGLGRYRYRRHRSLPPALLGFCGVICLVIALLPGLAEGEELWITVVGSLLLVTGQVMNWRLRTPAV